MIIVQAIHATFDQIDNFYVKSNFTSIMQGLAVNAISYRTN